MGLFSTLRAAAAKCYGGIRRVAKRVAEKSAEAARAAKASAAKILGKVTGKEKYEEAKARYKVLMQRAEEAVAKHSKFLDETFTETGMLLAAINARKRFLYQQQFPRFIDAAERFAHWEIPDALVLDDWCGRASVQIKTRRWADLKLIDFDNEKFKTYALSCLTLGFWTRKKAKETLLKVQEEEKALDLELEKLAAERKRHKLVLKSLRQIAHYFHTLTGLYDRVLDDVGFSATLLGCTRELMARGAADGRLDAYFLPRNHLLCLMAADKLTRILHDLAGRRYFDTPEEGAPKRLTGDFIAIENAMHESEIMIEALKIAA